MTDRGDKGEGEQQLIFNIGDQVAGYKIREKIDEGGFGQVFKVAKEEKIYAMKIESNMQEGGSAIKLEIDVLADLKMKKLENFPKFYQAGKRVKFHFLVMELLGENLKSLRYRSANPESLTHGTWSRVGIQCLFVIKTLHDSGFLHRDIKPSNFAMGNGEDVLKGRMIYLFDFGLARRFVLRKKIMENSSRPTKEISINESNREKTLNSSIRDKKSKERKCPKSRKRTRRKDDDGTAFQFRIARPHTDFRGTYQYASPNAHLLIELGRADDVWSLMYMLAEMTNPLPWAINVEVPIEELKNQTTLDMLFRNETFKRVEENLRSCNYYSAPDYDLVYQVMREILDKSGTKWNDPYDWETPELPAYMKWKEEKSKLSTNYPWEDPKDFFKKDVWAGIATPTLKKGEEKTKSKYAKVGKSEMLRNDDADIKTLDAKLSKESRENPSKEGGREQQLSKEEKKENDSNNSARKKPKGDAVCDAVKEKNIMQSIMAMNLENKEAREQKVVHAEKSSTNTSKDVVVKNREQSVMQLATEGDKNPDGGEKNASVYKVGSCLRQGASVMNGPSSQGMTLRKNPSMMGTIEDDNTAVAPGTRPKGSKGTGKKKDGALNKVKKLIGMKPSS